MSIFGQVWLWSLLAFFVGVLLTWLVLVLPSRKRTRELETALTAAHAESARTPANAGALAGATARFSPVDEDDFTAAEPAVAPSWAREQTPTELIHRAEPEREPTAAEGRFDAPAGFEPEAEYGAEYRTTAESASAETNVDEGFPRERENERESGPIAQQIDSGSVYRAAATEYLSPVSHSLDVHSLEPDYTGTGTGYEAEHLEDFEDTGRGSFQEVGQRAGDGSYREEDAFAGSDGGRHTESEGDRHAAETTSMFTRSETEPEESSFSNRLEPEDDPASSFGRTAAPSADPSSPFGQFGSDTEAGSSFGQFGSDTEAGSSFGQWDPEAEAGSSFGQLEPQPEAGASFGRLEEAEADFGRLPESGSDFARQPESEPDFARPTEPGDEPISLFQPTKPTDPQSEPAWFEPGETSGRSPFEEPDGGGDFLDEQSPTEHLTPSAEHTAEPSEHFGGDLVAVDEPVDSTQVLPKRQPREAPRGGFEPPRPIQPSMRPVERREPELAGTQSGSLFEPSVQPNQGTAAPLDAPEPPPARQVTGDAVPAGPFGPGSAMPRPGGGRPSEGFTVKASVTALRYCTEESPQFPRMVAEVWFRTTADAERVGFRPLS